MRLKHVKNAEERIKKGTHYIESPEEFKGAWNKIFKNNNPIHLEIGMGKGDFIIEKALSNPNINFVGLERYDSVIVRAIEKSNELELSNLKLIRIDARKIEDVFAKEIDTIYLNFSDPWPKDRHAKRRLTSPNFLEKYDHIFKDIPHIIMKTDNDGLFNYSKESLINYGYTINEVSDDLYNSNYLDGNIQTEYEKKFVSKGIKINYLNAVKK